MELCFSAPPSGTTMRQAPKRGARTCSRSSITTASLVGLGFHPPPGWPKMLSKFLFVCLSVCSSRFWTSEIVCPISPWRCWSTETIVMPLDRRRFVVVHSCSTLSDCCHLATTPNAEVQKTVKIGVFSPTEGNRINRSRRNLACRCIPWVCYSTPQLAVTGKRGLVAGIPQKVKICPKLCFLATGSWHSEHIQMKFGMSV